jgi:hypothetical protein
MERHRSAAGRDMPAPLDLETVLLEVARILREERRDESDGERSRDRLAA